MTCAATVRWASRRSISRPAGTYRISVSKSGFKRFDSKIVVTPGQELSLSAPLTKQDPRI